MTRAAQQARALQAANDLARGSIWPTDNSLLAKRSFQLGFAKGLLADMIAAAEAPADLRERFMNYAITRARRELGENGRLA